jgi:hypothetical protein
LKLGVSQLLICTYPHAALGFARFCKTDSILLRGFVGLMGRQRQNEVMKGMKSLYHGHRFPAVVIRRVVRWYFRFNLSLRDI